MIVGINPFTTSVASQVSVSGNEETPKVISMSLKCRRGNPTKKQNLVKFEDMGEWPTSESNVLLFVDL